MFRKYRSLLAFSLLVCPLAFAQSTNPPSPRLPGGSLPGKPVVFSGLDLELLTALAAVTDAPEKKPVIDLYAEAWKGKLPTGKRHFLTSADSITTRPAGGRQVEYVLVVRPCTIPSGKLGEKLGGCLGGTQVTITQAHAIGQPGGGSGSTSISYTVQVTQLRAVKEEPADAAPAEGDGTVKSVPFQPSLARLLTALGNGTNGKSKRKANRLSELYKKAWKEGGDTLTSARADRVVDSDLDRTKTQFTLNIQKRRGGDNYLGGKQLKIQETLSPFAPKVEPTYSAQILGIKN